MMLKWEKLESVNKMYIRTRTGIALSEEARKFKKEVAKQVRVQLPKVLPFTDKDVFKLSLHFVLKTRFFIRDTSNFIKIVEDTIFDELDINDARNIVLDCRKSYLKNSPYEFVKATIETSDFDYNYFNKPLKDPTPTLIDKTYTKQEVLDLLLEQSIYILNKSLTDSPKEIARNKGVYKPLKKPKKKPKKKSKDE
jgi:hypothetical protein